MNIEEMILEVFKDDDKKREKDKSPNTIGYGYRDNDINKMVFSKFGVNVEHEEIFSAIVSLGKKRDINWDIPEPQYYDEEIHGELPYVIKVLTKVYPLFRVDGEDRSLFGIYETRERANFQLENFLTFAKFELEEWTLR